MSIFRRSNPQDAIQPGMAAPDFSLPSSLGTEIRLSDFSGQPVILAFYPSDWSPVCSDQMVLYNEVLPMFEEFGAQLLGISVDGVWSHRAFAEEKQIGFPLLSDFEPKGAVAKSYGVFRDKRGTTERALFVIDGKGIVRWGHVSPANVNPGADGILNALEQLDLEKEQEHGA